MKVKAQSARERKQEIKATVDAVCAVAEKIRRRLAENVKRED